jgi:hypothetical protein
MCVMRVCSKDVVYSRYMKPSWHSGCSTSLMSTVDLSRTCLTHVSQNGYSTQEIPVMSFDAHSLTIPNAIPIAPTGFLNSSSATSHAQRCSRGQAAKCNG